MKPVPRVLLEEIQRLVPPDEDRRALEDLLLEASMDYDEAHKTVTLCLVWPKQKPIGVPFSPLT